MKKYSVCSILFIYLILTSTGTCYCLDHITHDTAASQIPFKDLPIRYAAELHRVPTGCQTIAMGNTGVCLPYNPTAINWNPASIALQEKYCFTAEGATLYGDISKFGVISFHAPVQNDLYSGLQYKAFFSDDIQETDSLPLTYIQRQKTYHINGYPIRGIFHNNHHSIIATISKSIALPKARPLPFSMPVPLDFGIGLNIKSLIQTMTPGNKVRIGYMMNFDFGALLRVGLDYNFLQKNNDAELIVALSIQDFIPSKIIWLHSYSNYREPVDATQLYGVAYCKKLNSFISKITISAALYAQYETTFHAGLEASLYNIVDFRCGLSDSIFSIGAGFHYKNYQFDYCFSFDELAYTYLRVGTSMTF